MRTTCILALMVLWATAQRSCAHFDVRLHLSSRTPYRFARPVPGSTPFARKPLPDGNKAVYLYFVTRHGTRWPTKKRLSQFLSLTELLRRANATAERPWLKRWESPFRGDWLQAGQLHPIGEDELQQMGARFRAYLPELFSSGYRAYETRFISTQVKRASASASAFAQGLFPCSNSSPGGGWESAGILEHCCRPQPVALKMLPKHEDPLLRFFDVCPGFDEYLAELKPSLVQWRLEAWAEFVERIETRLGTPPGSVTPEHVDSLWQLCQQEAALLGVVDHACALFTPQEAEMLEYLEDVVLFERRGHASCKAYSAAALLVADAAEQLSRAAAAASSPEGAEKARFHFAHAETIAPFAAFLGVHDSPGLCSIDANQSCGRAWEAVLPPPPNPRVWHASTAIPFAANIALMLHTSAGGEPFLRLLVNENVVPIPICGDSLDCPLPIFLDAYGSGLDRVFDRACLQQPKPWPLDPPESSAAAF